jgi:yeast amino acid transporter
MGWNYAMLWLSVLPLELTAAGMTVHYWDPNINVGILITVFLLFIAAINMVGVRGYGEAEFVFSLIKILAVIGFIICGIVIDVGGGPNKAFLGAQTWSDPGAFGHGFKGVCSVFVTAAFAFGGTELVGLTAAECDNPRKTLPRAARQVFWRITLFYMISLTVIGMLVPYNDPRLLGATSSVDVRASPFVIAISNSGIKVLPSIMNAVVLISVLSVGNSATYGATRTICAMAEIGQAPKIFSYIDKKGRPLVVLGLTLLCGCLAYINLAPSGGEVFTWLLSISGLCVLLTWTSICIAHLRFRKAWRVQGYSTDDIPYTAAFGIWGSWIGLLIAGLALVSQFYIALFPIGKTPNAKSFMEAYLTVPIVAFFFIVWKVLKRTRFVKASETDIITGRREMNVAQLKAEEAEKLKKMNVFKRAYAIVC